MATIAKKTKKPASKQTIADRALSKLYGAGGVNAGNAFMQKFLPSGALGNVEQNLVGAEENLQRFNKLRQDFQAPSAQQQQVLARMQGGLGGYTSPEMQAMREQNLAAQNSNLQTGLGQLARAQARGKVYGGAATAQQANMLSASDAAKNNLEQQLMIKNADEQQRRLAAYGGYAGQLQNQTYEQQGALTAAQAQEERATRDEQLNRQLLQQGNQQALLAARISGFQGTAGTALNKAQTRAAQRIQERGIAKLRG